MTSVFYFLEFVVYAVFSCCLILFSRLYFIYAFKAQNEKISYVFESLIGIYIIFCLSRFFAVQHTTYECIVLFIVLSLSVCLSYSDWYRHAVVADGLYIALAAFAYVQHVFGNMHHIVQALYVFSVLSVLSALSYVLMRELFVGFADVLYITFITLCFGHLFVVCVFVLSGYLIFIQYVWLCIKNKKVLRRFELPYLPTLSASVLFFYAVLNVSEVANHSELFEIFARIISV